MHATAFADPTALSHRHLAEPRVALLRPRVEERFDLGTKVALAERIVHNAVSDAMVHEYLTHLYKWNGLVEHGSDKAGAIAFLATFESIVKSLRDTGRYTLPPIPIGDSGAIQNGIHRLAASLATGIAPALAHVPGTDHRFDYRYFQQFECERGPFSRTTLLKMLFRNLSMWRGRYRVALMFPPSMARDGAQAAFDTIERHGTVLWDESFTCPPFFLKFLLLNAYPGEAWMGLGHGALGLTRKLNEVAHPTSDEQAVRLVVFLPHDGVDFGAVKKSVRANYAVGHSAMHISDAEFDSASLAMAYCSSMSDIAPLQHLNYDALSLQKLAPLSRELPKLVSHRERCLLVGSAALELYGGRTANDLDFIALGLPEAHDALGGHNSYAYLFEAPLEQLIDGLDAKRFVFGVPVASPETVMRFKTNRAEPKDLRDVTDMRSRRNS